MKRCPRCNGTGNVPDPLELGQTLKKMRIEAGISQARLAGAMKISPAHLCDLEQGKRGWMGEFTPELYCDALDAEIERRKQK